MASDAVPRIDAAGERLCSAIFPHGRSTESSIRILPELVGAADRIETSTQRRPLRPMRVCQGAHRRSSAAVWSHSSEQFGASSWRLGRGACRTVEPASPRRLRSQNRILRSAERLVP
jgi:hypothetical protein